MFVLADIEWVANDKGHCSPTQLAAVRVDQNWEVIDSFNTFIRPRDREFYDWDHVAYTGGNASSFLHARKAYNVLLDFSSWIQNDDVILWWYEESERLFKNLFEIILKDTFNNKMMVLNEYVYEYLSGQANSRGNAYRIAEGRNIDVNNALKHNSENDVRVMRSLMSTIKYPQELLLKPLIRSEKKRTYSKADLPYQYDPDTNKIHKKDCSFLANKNDLHGYKKLNTAFRRGYIPCECCLEDYRRAFRERNIDIIERTQYTYIFSPDSNVFHKYTCGLMLSAKNILGTRKYETVLKTGKKPCKVCNPTPNEKFKPLPPQYKEMILKKKYRSALSKQDAKAVIRQKGAVIERAKRLQEESLTETQISDIYTLTQPEYAFWAGQGYQTFHLRTCTKLQALSNLKGFKTYKQAISAGYSPCRKCKPSEIYDVTVSIPISNRVRKDERLEDIEKKCKDAGYSYYHDGAYFFIETPVGNWKINTVTLPIKVEHINRARTPKTASYHKQPRLFLSFIDTFNYIKRHDEELNKRERERKI